MQTSIFLARLIGPVLLAAAFGMLLNEKAYRAMAKEALGSYALIYLTGILGLAAGLAIVLTHNVWVMDWRVIVTLFGWLAVAGGVLRILAPDRMREIGKNLVKNDNTRIVSALVTLAIGAVLSFYGYTA